MANSKQKLGTLLLDKVDAAIVVHYLTEFGLSTDGDILAQVERLQAHQAKVPKQHIGDCDECKGAGDIRLPVCVFCGVGDEEDQVADAVATNPNATIEPAKPAKAKKSRSESGITPDQITHTNTKGNAIQTVAALDRNVRSIQDLKKEAVVSYWRLGKAIYENYSERLYTLREEDGKPKYKAFNQFVVAELNLSVSHAYMLMDVAVNFTEDDVGTYGVAKLALVARMPQAARSELLDRIREQNTPLSQVAEEVRRLAGGRRTETAASMGGGRGNTAAAGARGTAASAARAEVTVGIVMGKKTIQLMRGDAPDRPASTIQHDPYCEEQMLNGVVTKYRIVKNETGLALIITRTREGKPEKATKPAKAAKAKPATAPSSTEAPAKRGRGRPRKNPIA